MFNLPIQEVYAIRKRSVKDYNDNYIRWRW